MTTNDKVWISIQNYVLKARKNPLAAKASLKVTVRELMVTSVTVTSPGDIAGLHPLPGPAPSEKEERG